MSQVGAKYVVTKGATTPTDDDAPTDDDTAQVAYELYVYSASWPAGSGGSALA